jgi:hypothetical protein
MNDGYGSTIRCFVPDTLRDEVAVTRQPLMAASGQMLVARRHPFLPARGAPPHPMPCRCRAGLPIPSFSGNGRLPRRIGAGNGGFRAQSVANRFLGRQ